MKAKYRKIFRSNLQSENDADKRIDHGVLGKNKNAF